MKSIVIFGIGGVAETVFHYISSRSSTVRVVGFTVDKSHMKHDEWLGLPVVAFEDVEKVFPPEKYELLVVVTFQPGSSRWLLRDKSQAAQKKGYRLFSYIDKSADVAADVELGENCIVCPGVFIEPGAKIGHGVILRTASYIGHGVSVGDYCFIGPRAAMAGRAVIEPHTFIGANATIRDRVTIGRESIIGAGVVVLKDVAPKTVIKAVEGVIIPKDRDEVRL